VRLRRTAQCGCAKRRRAESGSRRFWVNRACASTGVCPTPYTSQTRHKHVTNTSQTSETSETIYGRVRKCKFKKKTWCWRKEWASAKSCAKMCAKMCAKHSFSLEEELRPSAKYTGFILYKCTCGSKIYCEKKNTSHDVCLSYTAWEVLQLQMFYFLR